MSAVVKYTHHGQEVFVREDLKGKHREHCLCWGCKRFIPEDRELNCDDANLVYGLCEALGMTLPVWECSRYISKEGRQA